mmetsp:Transcript_66005/g.177510  ORF Transcript_66005/g.177510 Transcript_66005/m.177510 type:complete len:203 (-) Transcript_66005:439-1047(-)
MQHRKIQSRHMSGPLSSRWEELCSLGSSEPQHQCQASPMPRSMGRRSSKSPASPRCPTTCHPNKMSQSEGHQLVQQRGLRLVCFHLHHASTQEGARCAENAHELSRNQPRLQADSRVYAEDFIHQALALVFVRSKFLLFGRLLMQSTRCLWRESEGYGAQNEQGRGWSEGESMRLNKATVFEERICEASERRTCEIADGADA